MKALTGHIAINYCVVPYYFRGLRNPFRLAGANPKNWQERVRAGEEIIILLHGSLSSQGFWIPLLKEFYQRGISHRKVVLTRNFDTKAGIAKGMEVLSEWLQELRDVNPNIAISLIGHSWGGILAAYAAFVAGEMNLKRLYLLAARCADRESEVEYNWLYRLWARWGVFNGEREQIGQIASALRNNGLGAFDVGVVYSPHDGLVPPDAASLRPFISNRDNIRELKLASCSHLNVLFQSCSTIADWISE